MWDIYKILHKCGADILQYIYNIPNYFGKMLLFVV